MANDMAGKGDGGDQRPSAWNELYEALNIDRQGAPLTSSSGAAVAQDMRQRLIRDQQIEQAQADPASSVVRLETKVPVVEQKARRPRMMFAAARQAARDAYGRTRFPDVEEAGAVEPMMKLPPEATPHHDVAWSEPASAPASFVPEAPMDSAEQAPKVFGRRQLPVEAPVEALQSPSEPVQEAPQPVESPVQPVAAKAEPVTERLVLGVPLSAVVRYAKADFMLATLDRAPPANVAPLAFAVPQHREQRRPDESGSAQTAEFALPRLPAAFGKFAAFGLIGLAGLVGIALILALGLLPSK